MTANMPALHLALQQDLLHYGAEDSDVVEVTLYGGAARLISALGPVLCTVRESLSRGMRPWRARCRVSGSPRTTPMKRIASEVTETLTAHR